MSDIEIRSLNGYKLCDETARGEIETLKQSSSTGVGRSGGGYGSEIFNSYGEGDDGPSNQAEGQYSHAENFATRALGYASHAEGYDTAALGELSHAEGERSEAHGAATHAEGITTKAYGLGSHSEGVGGSYVQRFRVNSVDTDTTYTKFNIVRSKEMPPLGAYLVSARNPEIITKVIEVDSVNQNFVVSTPLFNQPVTEYELATLAGIASGDYSHIEGNNNAAFGASSHAEGIYTIAVDDGSHVQGKYNIAESNYAHIIGNGTNINSKSNAHTLDWEGNAWYSGDVYVGSTSGTNKDEGSKKLATEEFVSNTVAAIPTPDVTGQIIEAITNLDASDVGAAPSEHTQAASTITEGTFGGTVAAKSDSQDPDAFLLRNSKFVSTTTAPSVSGEICWLYE